MADPAEQSEAIRCLAIELLTLKDELDAGERELSDDDLALLEVSILTVAAGTATESPAHEVARAIRTLLDLAATH